MHQSAFQCLMNGISISYSPLGSRQALWCRFWVLIPNGGHEPLAPVAGESLYLWGFSWFGVTGETTSLPLWPILRGPFIFCCATRFWVFFRGSCSPCSHKYGVSMGGGEFQLFLCHHLELILSLEGKGFKQAFHECSTKKLGSRKSDHYKTSSYVTPCLILNFILLFKMFIIGLVLCCQFIQRIICHPSLILKCYFTHIS